MKYLVVGIQNSEGDFTPVGSDKTYNYNNVVLQCFNYEHGANGGGYQVEKLKIKKQVFDKVMESSKLQRGDLLYSVCDIFYNQYTSLERIVIIQKMDLKLEVKK